jgi:ribosomal protein S18 acetylase RimI-like enzyme
MSATLIRKAISTDLTSINRLNAEIHEYHSENLPDLYKKLSPESFTEHTATFINGIDSETFVAEKSETIIGFVQVKVETIAENTFGYSSRRGLINALGVSSLGRREGIGSALMAAAEDWIRGQGLNQVVLNVLEFNQSAIHFYEGRRYHTSSRKLVRNLDK